MYYVYIMTNSRNTVFYTGMTNNLERRVAEHKSKSVSGFTAKYNVNKLLWYDKFYSPQEAIEAEKRIKDWRREKKIAIISETNSKFMDLAVNF